jgi:hypothetical protein
MNKMDEIQALIENIRLDYLFLDTDQKRFAYNTVKGIFYRN